MSFLGELHRRHVTKVAVVYAVVGLGVSEAADLFLGNLGAPSWAVPAVLIGLLLGFPVALVLAWAYDLTPAGVLKDGEEVGTEPVAGNGAVAALDAPPAAPVVPSDRRSIAVLPLANLSGDPDNEYFSDGMTDDILTALTFIEGLRVISRMSVMRYKGTTKNSREIASELGVGTVLEGSVRRSDNRVRVVVQLIDASNDEHIWADTYDRDLQDVFAVQSEVAESIAGVLESKLSPHGRARLATTPTKSLEAYELVLRARHEYLQVTQDHVDRGMELLHQAIELDPDYAVAHAHLAIAHFVLPYFSPVSPESIEASAREAIDRAFELDDTIPEAYAARGYWRFNFRWDWEGAEEDFARALELNPSFADAYAWRALMRHLRRRSGDAIDDARRSVSLDPLSFQTRSQLAQCLTWEGQPDAAMDILEEIVAEDPTNFISHWNLGVLKRPTDIETALTHFERALVEMDVPLGHASRSVTLRMLGRTEEADQAIDDLEARSGTEYVSPFALAVAYFGKGDLDRGFGYLEEGADQRDFLTLYLRLIAPSYGFQEHPRHLALLQRIWPDDFPESDQ